jgi:hypothetical protein
MTRPARIAGALLHRALDLKVWDRPQRDKTQLAVETRTVHFAKAVMSKEITASTSSYSVQSVKKR